MIKKTFIVLISFLAVSGFVSDKPERTIVHNSFGTGEHIEYRVHYGFFNAAEAIVDVDDKIQKVNSRPCYRVDVTGRTTGAFDLITRVRDNWRSYIDTVSILPQRFYQKKQEGDYRKEEQYVFDHAENIVRSAELNEANAEKYELKVPDNVQDVVSGYYFLRTVDFNRYKVGDIISVKAFFDREIYDMKMTFRGKEVIKTKFGKINVVKIKPIVPPNKFFDGTEPISIWVTDDQNKVPVKVEIELAIGSIACDIKKYSGLKTEPKWF